MKMYEVSREQGKFNNSITIDSNLFECLEEAIKLFDLMKKRVIKNEVLYLMSYEEDTTLADVIDFKEGE